MTPQIDVARELIEGWYDEYRRLRHRVFVEEQRWPGLSSVDEPGLTATDPIDRRACFWRARSADGALIGAVRVCALSVAFPHAELFAPHLTVPAVLGMRHRLGTLNSLVVDVAWRGHRCVDGSGRAGTVSELVLRHCLSECAPLGIDGLLATAQTVISVRALMRAGFRVIDRPVTTSLHPTFAMCNVGAVPSPADTAAAALLDYFSRRERIVLGDRSIDERFAGVTATVTPTATVPPAAGALR